MTKSTELTAALETEATQDAKPIEVDPAKVDIQIEGQHWREWSVHLPAAASKVDLQEPSIWRRCQVNPRTALAVKDIAHVFAEDESWVAVCRVYRADKTGAWLRFSKVSDFREVGDGLWRDDTLEVRFASGSFWVHRRSDGVRALPHGFITEAMAIGAAMRSYPQRVA